MDTVVAGKTKLKTKFFCSALVSERQCFGTKEILKEIGTTPPTCQETLLKTMLINYVKSYVKTMLKTKFFCWAARNPIFSQPLLRVHEDAPGCRRGAVRNPDQQQQFRRRRPARRAHRVVAQLRLRGAAPARESAGETQEKSRRSALFTFAEMAPLAREDLSS